MRILLIDDEPLLLKSYGRYLRRSGDHETVTAAGGSEALERLEGDEPFDLVFCDLAMSDMGGIEIHRAVCEFHSYLLGRFVFMTGGITDEVTQTYVEESNVPVLAKPIRLAEFEKILAGSI